MKPERILFCAGVLALLFVTSHPAGLMRGPSVVIAAEGTPAVVPAPDQPRRNQKKKLKQQQSAQSQPASVGDRRGRGRDEPAGEPDAEGTGPKGMRLTGESFYNVQPAVLPKGDGSNWLAWVGYLPGGGDFLFVGSEKDGVLDGVNRITSQPTDLFRPVLVQSEEVTAGKQHRRERYRVKQTLLLWTQTIPDKGPSIFYSALGVKGSSDPQQIPGLSPHTLNPEAAEMPGGAIAVVYQVFHENVYGIGMKTFKLGKWSDETIVSMPAKGTDGPLDCWDPVTAYDAKSGKLFIAWVSYYAHDYDLCWRTYADGKLGAESRIVHEGYDLHPCALADPKGGVWLTWDSVTIPSHGTSGRTHIKHPNKYNVGAQNAQCYIAAAKWNGASFTVPQTCRVSGEKENVQHGGTPKLGWDRSGRLYIVYRALHQPVSGRTMYYWDMNVRTLDGAKWTDPVRLAESDGPTEEASVISGGEDSVRIYFQRDYRRSTTAKDGNQVPRLANDQLTAFFSHHADYGEPKLRHGDVLVASVPGAGSKPQAVDAFKFDPIPEVKLKQFEPYKKGEYTVLFGDLHKHSNVSRCSRGAEPDPDDHYRYSRDVCRYDFLGISDHAAHTSDYNWWRLQKLADLYYTPGDFTTLFGVEWNGPEGHKNVMSPSRHLPLLATSGVAPNAMKLWEELDKAGVPALTIPHTSSLPGQDCDWTKHNEKYQRLVEIFQACRGSFEGKGAPRMFPQATLDGQHVQDALAMHYRLGIICSTDHGYGASYCCLYAKENTREGVFDALYDRRTYGSTAYGIIVDFNVNGVMMGRDVKRSGDVMATGYVRGADKLDKVQILKDNKVVQEWNPSGNEQDIAWKDPEPGTGLHWYYLRVIQEDDEMAWSSPSWVVD